MSTITHFKEEKEEVIMIKLLEFWVLGTGQNISGTRAGTIDRGVKTFFTKKIENPRFHFSKKAIFENQKRIIYAWKILEGIVPNLSSDENQIRSVTTLRYGRPA